MPDFGVAYAGARERISELVSAATEEELGRIVPGCPEWSVKDLLAHVVGIARDFESGNLGDAGQPGWTAGHVEAGKERSVAELIAEWKEASVQLEASFEHIPKAMSGMTLADLVTHEHDLRGALGKHGARDTDGVTFSLESYVRYFGHRLKKAGLPPLTVTSGGKGWNLGEGAATTSVAGEPFELFRCLAGRRTTEEIRALEWTGDKEIFVPHLSNYGAPEPSLGE
jgi:uncharacterized protein (TIGR03083 family)